MEACWSLSGNQDQDESRRLNERNGAEAAVGLQRVSSVKASGKSGMGSKGSNQIRISG